MKNVMLALGFCLIGALPSAAQYSGTPYSGSPVQIPGTVHAENFDNGGEGVAYHDADSANLGGAYRSTGVDVENSANGTFDVGWIVAGEWTNYTINVASAGPYTIYVRSSSPYGGSMHVGFNNGSNVWQQVTLPNTGGWQNWAIVSFTANLGAGTQQLTLMSDTGGYNLDLVTISSGGTVSSSTVSTSSSSSASSSSTSGLSPFHGSPAAVPGTIEAEDFDNGGEGLAYHDSDSVNTGGAYRSTGVDIEPASSGGYDVGWFSAGEWMNYTINVPSAGSYTVTLRVASMNGGSLHVGFNTASNVWQPVWVNGTGGWQSWTTVSFPAWLGAGTQQMTIMADTGGVNVDSINIGSGGSVATSSVVSSAPSGSGTSLPVVHWNIQINDGSDAHARTAMDVLLSSGPRPEVIVIVEAWSTLYNTYIDELQRQTGQTWYGAFATHCPTGSWNGSTCTTSWYQGVGIFSTHPITGQSSRFFPYADCWTSARVGLRAQIDLNGLPVQVFATHLQTGGCANDAQSRYASMGDLKAWASNYPAPQIAAGDFNADPDQIDTTSGMQPNFVDSWFVAGVGSRFTAFAPNPSMKIDYWFSDASGRATATTSVVNTGTSGVSDHFPVEATFWVK